MRCEKIEKWISDSVDKPLRAKEQRILGEHLARCASCQAYERSLKKMQQELTSRARPEVPPAYWEQSLDRLQKRLNQLAPERDASLSWLWGKRWAWAGIGVVLVTILVLSTMFFKPRSVQESTVFSFGDSVSELYSEFQGNSDLEDTFNSVILASIAENLGELNDGFRAEWYHNLFDRDDLTEDDLKFLESELKRELKLKEGSDEV